MDVAVPGAVLTRSGAMAEPQEPDTSSTLIRREFGAGSSFPGAVSSPPLPRAGPGHAGEGPARPAGGCRGDPERGERFGIGSGLNEGSGCQNAIGALQLRPGEAAGSVPP